MILRAALFTTSATAGLLALAAAPALAGGSTISINPGNVPTTAAGFSESHSCSADFGGGPFRDADVWVFNLPNNANKAGDFTTVTAQFDTNGDHKADRTVVIEAGAADRDDIVRRGTSKAWAATAAGWTLVGATAKITGAAPQFVLTHTCAASSSGATASPTPTASGSAPSDNGHGQEHGNDGGKPEGHPTSHPTGHPSKSPEPGKPSPEAGHGTTAGHGPEAKPSSTPSPAPDPTATASTSSGSLPVTGTALGGLIGLATMLTGGGATALMLVRRRRATGLNPVKVGQDS